jgi:hypothetical protein
MGASVPGPQPFAITTFRPARSAVRAGACPMWPAPIYANHPGLIRCGALRFHVLLSEDIGYGFVGPGGPIHEGSPSLMPQTFWALPPCGNSCLQTQVSTGNAAQTGPEERRQQNGGRSTWH